MWKIVEDKDAPKGPKVLAQTSADAPGAVFNLCVNDKAKFKDLDLSVAFKAVAGEVDQGGGPVWRYQDAENYYVARVNPLEDNFRVYKVVAGKRIQLGTAKVEAAKNKWHTIRVVQKGDHIQCYLNGKMHLDVKDDAFKDAGKIGLWTKADAQTYFDELVVRKAEAMSSKAAAVELPSARDLASAKPQAVVQTTTLHPTIGSIQIRSPGSAINRTPAYISQPRKIALIEPRRACTAPVAECAPSEDAADDERPH